MARGQHEIRRNDEEGRFELVDGPADAVLGFRRAGERLRLVHTEVDEQLEGEGVGSALVREALDYAEEQGLAIVPECDFVAAWLDKHPERAAELDVAAS
jgi:uncharacterized protein